MRNNINILWGVMNNVTTFSAEYALRILALICRMTMWKLVVKSRSCVNQSERGRKRLKGLKVTSRIFGIYGKWYPLYTLWKCLLLWHLVMNKINESLIMIHNFIMKLNKFQQCLSSKLDHINQMSWATTSDYLSPKLLIDHNSESKCQKSKKLTLWFWYS